MLSYEEARKIAVRSCMEKIGMDYCLSHTDRIRSFVREKDGMLECSFTLLYPLGQGRVTARCKVDKTNGAVLELVVSERESYSVSDISETSEM